MHKSIENPPSQLLLFGGTGAIGNAVRTYFSDKGWIITVVGRSFKNEQDYFQWDPVSDNSSIELKRIADHLENRGPFAAVCWAQGKNSSDSLYDFNATEHQRVYDANVTYILKSLSLLIKSNLLAKPARLCVVSSIWQRIARQNKLSYCVSKAALQGLVLSAAVDLARDGHFINAVLPGVIDTPMTRANLQAEQIQNVETSTLFGRLPALADVASTIYGLCSRDSSVTGQFISVDLGFSNARIL